jgi:hypothetical protein
MTLPLFQSTPTPTTPLAIPTPSPQKTVPPAELSQPQPLAQPRQDVLAIDGKLYVETTPQQLLRQQHQQMARQHRQPEWMNNLITSGIFGLVWSGVGTVVGLLGDWWKKEDVFHPEYIKAKATQFAGSFATLTIVSFIAFSILDAIRKKQNN